MYEFADINVSSCLNTTIRIEGFAIVSEERMVADANGLMPSALINEADQKFLSDGLDRPVFPVHGRRRRLIAI
jgi:hypothetical protein